MSSRRRELLVIALLAAGAVLVWALVRTYPNYDAYYHLVWGRELLDGDKPSLEAYKAPTQHPLYLVLAALTGALAGSDADRVLVLFTGLALVALVWGVYRLGRAVFGTWPGIVAALLTASSLSLLLYAARAYVDVPFLALVLWAAALEAEKPRRGTSVMVLLALAGHVPKTARPSRYTPHTSATSARPVISTSTRSASEPARAPVSAARTR